MDILNMDMVQMWEYLEDLEDLMKGREDIQILEQMQESAQETVDLQVELATTIADDFVRLNVECELLLRQMTGNDYQFKGTDAANRLIQPALEKRLKKHQKSLDSVEEDDSNSEESEVQTESIQSGVTRPSQAVGIEQKKANLFKKFVAMTDRVQHVRLDL